MPGAVYDADISGDGDDDLAGSAVIYAICHMGTIGGGVRELETGSPDHILRAGWISFGDVLSAIGATPRSYWRSVWWLDFVDSMYTPDPSTAGGPTTLVATRVRWHLPPGGAAHLYVFG